MKIAMRKTSHKSWKKTRTIASLRKVCAFKKVPLDTIVSSWHVNSENEDAEDISTACQDDAYIQEVESENDEDLTDRFNNSYVDEAGDDDRGSDTDIFNNSYVDESEDDGRGSDSDFDPTFEEIDEDEIDGSETCTLCQVLETKIKNLFQELELPDYLLRTQEHASSRSNTSATRAAKYLAFAISRRSTISDIDNFSKKALRRVLYQKDIFLYEYCDWLSETKFLKPGSIVNILLDILMVGKWLHYYANIKISKDCHSPWQRFENTVSTCKALWHKKGKRNRRESTKSLEELVSEGKLPRHGILDIQKIVSRHIGIVTPKVETWLQTKVQCKLIFSNTKLI
jgi:polyhydroxyalkanoate synthesis regulator phasin